LNSTCSSDNSTRFQCEAGGGGAIALRGYNQCTGGCSNATALCVALGGGQTACQTTLGVPVLNLNCNYPYNQPTGPLSVYTYLGSGAACLRQTLVNVQVLPAIIGGTNNIRIQCEGANIVTYNCQNASGAVGCVPILDSVAGPIAPGNCTVFQGNAQTGNATSASCASPFSDPNATQVVPVLAYNFYASGNCQTQIFTATNQTSYCDNTTGNNFYGQCENRTGTVVLATYACGSPCNGNLATANCIDFTGTPLGLPDSGCVAFSQSQSARFSCQPIVNPTASTSFTSISLTSSTAQASPSSVTSFSSRSTATLATSATTATVSTSRTSASSLATSPSSKASPTTTVGPTPKSAGQLSVSLALVAALLL